MNVCYIPHSSLKKVSGITVTMLWHVAGHCSLSHVQHATTKEHNHKMMKQLGFLTLIDNLKWYIFLMIFNFYTVRHSKPESVKGLIISQTLTSDCQSADDVPSPPLCWIRQSQTGKACQMKQACSPHSSRGSPHSTDPSLGASMRSWVCAGLQPPLSQLLLGHWELKYRCKQHMETTTQTSKF